MRFIPVYLDIVVGALVELIDVRLSKLPCLYTVREKQINLGK